MGDKETSSLYTPVWFILAVRLLHLSIVRSWFVPDEYWQSLEVAHHIVFGYGHLTWEWSQGIRSYVYVVFVAAQYYLLKFFHLDYVQLLIFVPRLVQTLISTLADVCLLRWISRMTSRTVATLAGTFLMTSACVAYCATRTLINTLEMNLVCFALNVYPWSHVIRNHDRTYLWIVAFSCLLRPTLCILWLPLCLYDLGKSPSPFGRLLFDFLPVGLCSLTLSTLLDSWFHQAWTFTPWNFLRINVLSNVSSHYSVQPWYWYLTIGLSSVWGSLTVPFYCYVVKTLYQGRCHHVVLFGTFVWTLFVYSCIGHKEFRFLLPLVPILLLYTSLQVHSWLHSAAPGWVYTLISGAVLIETSLLVFLSLFHQVGVINVMPHLRLNDHHSTQSILFLMPCHSTPLYSHLHVNVSTRFLTCVPNLAPLHSSSYLDEAAIFYQDPIQWLSEQYGGSNPGEKEFTVNNEQTTISNENKIINDDLSKFGNSRSSAKNDAGKSQLSSTVENISSIDSSKGYLFPPTIVVCFDVLIPKIQGWLRDKGYKLEKEIYHSLVPLESRIGRYVMLYSRSAI